MKLRICYSFKNKPLYGVYSFLTCTYSVRGIRATGQWVLHSDASSSSIDTKVIRRRHHPKDSVLNVVLKDKMKMKSTPFSSRVELESYVLSSTIISACTKQTDDKSWLHRLISALPNEPETFVLQFKYLNHLTTMCYCDYVHLKSTTSLNPKKRTFQFCIYFWCELISKHFSNHHNVFRTNMFNVFYN